MLVAFILHKLFDIFKLILYYYTLYLVNFTADSTIAMLDSDWQHCHIQLLREVTNISCEENYLLSVQP